MAPLAPTSVLLYTKKRGILPGAGKVAEAPDPEDKGPWDQHMEVREVVVQATEVVVAAVHMREEERMTRRRMGIDEVGLVLAVPEIVGMVIEAAVHLIEDVGVLASAAHTIEATTVVDRGAEAKPVGIMVESGHQAQHLRVMKHHKTVNDQGAEATTAGDTVVRGHPAQTLRAVAHHKTVDDQGVPTHGVVSGPAVPVS